MNQGRRRGANADVASGYLKRIIIFDDNLVACEMQKSLIKLNKPIQVGFIVLEHSKLQMYDFHYRTMRELYNNFNLVYMDTDSLVYNIITKDFYVDLKKLADEGTEDFDTSNYGDVNRFNVKPVNHQKLGTMKDELGGKIIKKFVGLRAKCYMYETDDDCKHVRAKGVQKNVSMHLTMDDFERCFLDRTMNIVKEQRYFRSNKHKMYTEVVQKIALNGGDTKRFVLDDGVHTLAWGHYEIDEALNV